LAFKSRSFCNLLFIIEKYTT